ncbi:MAG: hypothetical protein R6U78_14595 [Bacteroidales bacterium]
MPTKRRSQPEAGIEPGTAETPRTFVYRGAERMLIFHHSLENYYTIRAVRQADPSEEVFQREYRFFSGQATIP